MAPAPASRRADGLAETTQIPTSRPQAGRAQLPTTQLPTTQLPRTEVTTARPPTGSGPQGRAPEVGRGSGSLRGRLSVVAAVAVSLPMAPEVLAGGLSLAGAALRFLLALVVSWFALGLLAHATRSYRQPDATEGEGTVLWPAGPSEEPDPQLSDRAGR